MKKGTVRLGAAPREYHCFVCSLNGDVEELILDFCVSAI